VSVDPFQLIEGPSGRIASEPWDVYARLRRCPPAYSPARRCWFVGRFDEVLSVLLDDAFTASHPFRASRLAFGPTILDTEDPDHQECRAIFRRAFRPSVVESIEVHVVRPAVERAFERHCAGVTADLGLVADEVPLDVICELLGLDPRARQTVAASLRPLVRVIDAGMSGVAGIEAAKRTLLAIVDAQLAGDREGAHLSNALVAAVEVGALSRADALRHAILFLVAGTATTACAIAGAGSALLADEARQDDLRQGRVAVPVAVREALRLEPPLRFTPRFAVRGRTIAGVRIPEGAALQLCIPSANRDESVFAEPDRWSFERDAPVPLTFGRGLHGCIGSALAEAEVGQVVAAALRSWATIQVGPERGLAPGFSLRRPARPELVVVP
jgi:cytochrome P450